MKKRTLIDFLYDMQANYPNEVFKVGSGAAYFYIGTADDLIEKLDELSEKFQRNFIRSNMSAQAELKRLLSNPPSIGDYCKKIVAKNFSSHSFIENVQNERFPEFSMEAWNKVFKGYLESVKKSYIKAAHRKMENDTFVPLDEREVLSINTSLVAEENGTKCVIISGYERGKYWLVSEVGKDITKEDRELDMEAII